MNYILKDTPFVKKLQTMGLILLVLGAVGLGIGMTGSSKNLWAGFLIGFVYAMGIGVTMMFFSAVTYLVNAGWAAAVRRIAELLSFFVYVIPIGLIIVIIGAYTGHLYEWFHTTDEHLRHGFKGFYLNPTFFVIRLLVYAGLWFLMHRFVVGNSIKQDTATDITPTERNWKRAAPFVIIYALTITFASFDLVMSLEPHWFSTIFGVYSFAGHFVASLCIIMIMMRMLDDGGYMKGIISREHYHDIGKLMFAFTIFWTYVAFSQYFIIWYGNMPEETFFYHNRLHNGWEVFGWGSLFIHFVAPFLFLLRQDVKRNPKTIYLGAFLLLFAHFIDLSWVILPVFGGEHGSHGSSPTPQLILAGLGGVMLMMGCFFIFGSMQFKKRSFIAYNDPYLHESLTYSSGSYDRI